MRSTSGAPGPAPRSTSNCASPATPTGPTATTPERAGGRRAQRDGHLQQRRIALAVPLRRHLRRGLQPAGAAHHRGQPALPDLPRPAHPAAQQRALPGSPQPGDHPGQAPQGLIAVMFIDMDRFRQVNETHGQAKATPCPRSVALRLQQCLRAGDTLTRHRSDEFVGAAARHQRSGRRPRHRRKGAACLPQALP